MKKPVFFRSIISVILSVMLISSTCSQSLIPVRGTGTPVDKQVNVADFNGIDVSSGFDVILVQGNSESLTLTAQENLLEYITATVENGTLKIYARKNIMSTRPLKARITFKEISNLKVRGGGDTYSETPVNAEALDVTISGGGDFRSTLNCETLKCSMTGGGDTEIGGKAENYNINISGGGDLKSGVDAGIIICRITGGGDLSLTNDARASEADISVNGGGDMDMKMSAEHLKCSVSGGGDAIIAGQASEFELNIDGGGDTDARNLSSDITSFNVRGGSDIRVNASKELSGSISGGGDVYYSGNPGKFSVNTSGGSKVHKE